VLILLYTLVMGVFPSLLLALWCRYLARWRVPWLLSCCVRTATRTFLLETLRQGRSPHSRRERECHLPPLHPRVGAMGPQSTLQRRVGATSSPPLRPRGWARRPPPLLRSRVGVRRLTSSPLQLLLQLIRSRPPKSEGASGIRTRRMNTPYTKLHEWLQKRTLNQVHLLPAFHIRMLFQTLVG
jgi:hypothetical protein